MRFSIVALAASLIAAVMAQEAYPTMPIESTVWTAGTAVTVTWKANATTALSVDLFKGDPTHQTLVQNLGTGTAGGTSLKVTLPATLTADYYSVRIGDAYSHYFVIKSATGATPTGVMPTVAATTVAATTTAATTTAATTAATTATSTKAAATTAAAVSGASYLSAAPMAMAVAAVVAAAMAF
ncbi:hypothetical protein EDD21DRAFT_360564 [Dissophora ornata]|nr:hypothetical protein BGZ58_005350 [Dissophora ornata]KAI8606639.1 hypothetical protein EDD21DRAFT_360564 [Dissophora ornata]